MGANDTADQHPARCRLRVSPPKHSPSFHKGLSLVLHPLAQIPRAKEIVRRRQVIPIPSLISAVFAAASPAYERCVAASFAVPEADRQKGMHKWRLDSANARGKLAKLGCAMANQNPWTDSGAALRGLVGTPRQKDIVNVAFLSTCFKLRLHPASAEAAEAARSCVPGGLGLVVDVSQSVHRRPWSLGRLHTVTTSTKAYSFGLERVLAPEELLVIYGWPRGMAEATHTIGRTDMRKMVGETMALPTVGAAMAALLVAAYD